MKRTTVTSISGLQILVVVSLLAKPLAPPITYAQKGKLPGLSKSLLSQPDAMTISGSPIPIHVDSNAGVQVCHDGYTHG
jgi:hypothetical protein